MVLAPFFLALGAFGGGLFVASPCVGVSRLCRRERFVATAFVCGPARVVRRCVATCGGGAFLCASVREGCGGVRRVFRGPRVAARRVLQRFSRLRANPSVQRSAARFRRSHVPEPPP